MDVISAEFRQKMNACGTHVVFDDELWEESGKPHRLLYPCELGIEDCSSCVRNPDRDREFESVTTVVDDHVHHAFAATFIALGVIFAVAVLIGSLTW